MEDAGRDFSLSESGPDDPEKVARQAMTALRESRGWNYSDLARRLDTTPTQSRRLELGDLKISLPWMRRMARVFGVKMSAFLPMHEIDLPLDDATREILSAVSAVPPSDRHLVADIARQLIGLSKRLGRSQEGPMLQGDRHLAEQVAGVWEGWSQPQRQRAVELLKLMP